MVLGLFLDSAEKLTSTQCNYVGDVTLEVKVRFFTNLREIVGKREENLNFLNSEKVTVDTALMALSKKYGTPFVNYVYNAETGQPKSFLQFLINGKSTSSLDRFETTLKNGDVLAILPPVGGG